LIRRLDSDRGTNKLFGLIFIFCLIDIAFSWYSPQLKAELTPLLIKGEEKLDVKALQEVDDKKNSEPQLKPNPANVFVKVNGLEFKASFEGINNDKLFVICDGDDKTRLNVSAADKDQLSLSFSNSKVLQGFSVNISGDEKIKVQMQTSADGLVYNPSGKLKKGDNYIPLKGERVKTLRLIVTGSGKCSFSDFKVK